MGDISDEQRAALTAHNDARAQKGVPGLAWDAGLAGEAQAYAEQLAGSRELKHSGVQGESFFLCSFLPFGHLLLPLESLPFFLPSVGCGIDVRDNRPRGEPVHVLRRCES